MMREGPGENPILGRHNAILNILIEEATLSDGVDIPEYSSDSLLRPDLVVLDHSKKTATIVDAACPFENGNQAFLKTRDVKRTKYDSIKVNLESKGYRVIFDAFVVESLGSWDPLNADVLAALNISGKRRASVAKHCMQTAIRASYHIWQRRCLAESESQ